MPMSALELHALGVRRADQLPPGDGGAEGEPTSWEVSQLMDKHCFMLWLGMKYFCHPTDLAEPKRMFCFALE